MAALVFGVLGIGHDAFEIEDVLEGQVRDIREVEVPVGDRIRFTIHEISHLCAEGCYLKAPLKRALRFRIGGLGEHNFRRVAANAQASVGLGGDGNHAISGVDGGIHFLAIQ